jgi:hypothetical protein
MNEKEFLDSLPSAEHRRHIRLFRKSDLTDEEDVFMRGFVFWKRLNARLVRAAATVKKSRTNRGRRD